MKMSKKIIVLDAGHGGHDPGATGNGLREKDIALDVVMKTFNYIHEHYPSIDCRPTRTNDRFIELIERSRFSNRIDADCFVSVHVNSAGSTAANGVESFRHTSQSAKSKAGVLQNLLHKRLAAIWKKHGRADRGKKSANFSVVRETDCPAVLVELGFIVNSKDANLLKSDAFLSSQAQAIGDGIAEFVGAEKKAPTAPAQHVYRVIVNGGQVGAFAEPENVSGAVEKAVRSGASKVEVNLIK